MPYSYYHKEANRTTIVLLRPCTNCGEKKLCVGIQNTTYLCKSCFEQKCNDGIKAIDIAKENMVKELEALRENL